MVIFNTGQEKDLVVSTLELHLEGDLQLLTIQLRQRKRQHEKYTTEDY